MFSGTKQEPEKTWDAKSVYGGQVKCSLASICG